MSKTTSSPQDDEPKEIKNITRFNGRKTSFEGWRVNKEFNNLNFHKYVPDRKRKPETSLKEAKQELKELLVAMKILEMKKLIKWARINDFKLLLGKEKI